MTQHTSAQLAHLERQFTPLHTHLQNIGQHNTAHGLLTIFQELKSTVLQLLEKAEGQQPVAQAPRACLLSPEWPKQVLDLLGQIERTTSMTDKNVDTILSNWGSLKDSIAKLITLAQEAVTVEPDDPRADQIAQEMAQLKSTIDPIVATPAPAPATVQAAVQGAAGGTTQQAVGAAAGTAGSGSTSSGIAGAPATGDKSTVTGGTGGAVSG